MSLLRDMHDASVLGCYAPYYPVMIRGAGAELFDEEGMKYIDLGAGVAVNSLGHAYPPLLRALADQASRLMHVSNLYVNERAPRVARKLAELAGLERVFFCNSGVEANECALKLARKRGAASNASKHRVISFTGSFHGRIGMSLAASAQPKLWTGHGPQPPGFVHLPLGDERALREACGADLCAVIIEPVQGEGGIKVVRTGFLRLVREMCDEHDALMIVDEVQCGAGRTGAFFRSVELRIAPDILTVAKGVGGGFPVGAAIVGERARDVFGPGDHGTTYGANPLAMAAVETVLDTVSDGEFLAGVRRRGELARQELAGVGGPVQEVRGLGLMLGLQLDPDGLDATHAAVRCLKEGVLTVAAAGNVLRVMPPLNIAEHLLTEGIARIGRALAG